MSHPRRSDGEDDAPEGMKGLMSEAKRLRDIFRAEFQQTLTANQLLERILARARNEGLGSSTLNRGQVHH